MAMRDEITASANAAFDSMQKMANEAMAAAKGRFQGKGVDLESTAGRSRALAKLMCTDDDGVAAYAEQHLTKEAVLNAEDLVRLRDCLLAFGAALASADADSRDTIAQVRNLVEASS